MENAERRRAPYVRLWYRPSVGVPQGRRPPGPVLLFRQLDVCGLLIFTFSQSYNGASQPPAQSAGRRQDLVA
jgi:hypothetical protein